MRIGYDIDGVFADFTFAATTLARRLGLVDAAWTCAEQKSWTFDFDVDPMWRAIENETNWWMTLPPMVEPFEVERVNESIREHDVYFITNRLNKVPYGSLHIEAQTRHWLEGLGVNVARTSVIATPKGSKGRVARALGVEVFVDDNVENLIELRENGVYPVRRIQEYNSATNDRLHGVPAVGSLAQFVQRLGTYKTAATYCA